ncbi:MAG: Hpt domain-containing protein, partial [Nitrospirota bacterium]
MAGWSDTHRQAFKEEAYELLGELETALLDLEERPDDPDLIGRVFRAMHTIKGSGAMCGFGEVAAFTHEVETVFDLVRNGSVAVSRELIDLTLSSRDLIRAMIDVSNGDGDAAVERSGEIVTGLKRLVPGSAASPGRPLPASRKEDSGAAEGTGGLVTYRIYFSPAPDIFARGVNPLLLLNELRSLGGCNIVAHTETIPMLEEFDPEQCRTAWEVLLTTDKGINAVKDVFIFIADDSKLDIEVVRTPAGVSADGGSIESAFLEQHHARAQREDSRKNESGQKGESSASMRVPSEKLDSLVDLVGELVTVQARLSQFSGMRREPALQVIAEEVERISTSLRDKVMNIRMLPIGSTFTKFKRLVRDLSKELGKEIELTTEGAETELD